jgi:hypothetical protein
MVPEIMRALTGKPVPSLLGWQRMDWQRMDWQRKDVWSFDGFLKGFVASMDEHAAASR